MFEKLFIKHSISFVAVGAKVWDVDGSSGVTSDPCGGRPERGGSGAFQHGRLIFVLPLKGRDCVNCSFWLFVCPSCTVLKHRRARADISLVEIAPRSRSNVKISKNLHITQFLWIVFKPLNSIAGLGEMST